MHGWQIALILGQIGSELPQLPMMFGVHVRVFVPLHPSGAESCRLLASILGESVDYVLCFLQRRPSEAAAGWLPAVAESRLKATKEGHPWPLCGGSFMHHVLITELQ